MIRCPRKEAQALPMVLIGLDGLVPNLHISRALRRSDRRQNFSSMLMLGLRWSGGGGGGGGGAWCSAAPQGSVFPVSFRRRTPTRPRRRTLALVRSPEGGGRGAVRSPDMVELEYADLNLKDFYGGGHLGHVRIRQHVNPLSSAFSAPVQVPDWKGVFRDSTLPLMVDIGCGSGRFLIWLAKHSPEPRNYLGLEIRQKLVERSQFWVNELGLRNISFMFANAMVSFEQLVPSYPGPLTLVSILCPDPHFKKKHHKRRVLQKPLVNSISKNLCMEGQVFLQSDVLEVALDMRNQFDARLNEFEHIDAINAKFLCDTQGWLLHNPMGIRTEREIHAELEGAKIFRRMYQKRNHPPSV